MFSGWERRWCNDIISTIIIMIIIEYLLVIIA